MRRVILTYHGINDSDPAISLDMRSFVRQVEYMQSKNVRFLPLSVLLCWQQHGISIIFDDALCSMREAAVFLKSKGIPFGISVIYEKIGKDWYLNKMDIDSLAEGGCAIFSHSLSHPRLNELDDNRLTDEIVKSRMELEKVFWIPINTFVYPYGDYDDRVVESVKKWGYNYALSLLPFHCAKNDNPLLIPRICIDDKVSFRKFKLLISSWWSIYLSIAFIKRKLFWPHYLLNK